MSKILKLVFKILFIPGLFLASILFGLWFGYVRLGGQSTSDMFSLETWLHLFKLVFQ